MELSNKNDLSENAETLFLIIKYLQSFPELNKAKNEIEENLKHSDSLGFTICWDGSKRINTVVDIDRKHPLLPKDQLIYLLKSASKNDSNENRTSFLSLKSLIYNFSIVSQRREFSDLSLELSKILLSIGQCKEKIRTLKYALVFQNESELPSKNPEFPTLETLQEIGKNKDIIRLENEILLENENIKNLQIKKINKYENLQSKGLLLSGLNRGRIDNQIDWISAKLLGINKQHSMNRAFSSSFPNFSTKKLNNFNVLYTISGHMLNPAYCSVFDRTGQFLLTGADDYLVKIWDVRKGQLIKTCKGHSAYISLIAVSPDNSLFASSCTLGTIRIWRLSDGVCIKVLKHQSTINWIKFDASSGALASGSDDGHCIVWDLSKIIPKEALNIPVFEVLYSSDTKHNDPLPALSSSSANAVDFSSDHNIVSQSSSEFIQSFHPGLFDWSNESTTLESKDPFLTLPHLKETIEGDSMKVLCLDISPLGHILVTGCEDSIARVWKFDSDLNDSRYPIRPTKRPLELDILKLKFSAMPNKYPQIEKMADRLLMKLGGHLSPITDIQFNSLGDRLLTGSCQDGSVRIWSLSKDFSSSVHIVLDLNEEEISNTNLNFSRRRRNANNTSSRIQVYNVCWTNDDLRVVTIQSVPNRSQNGSQDNPQPTRLKVWDSITGDLLRIIWNISDTSSRCLISHPINPSIVITGGDDGIINVWDIEQEENLSSNRIKNDEGKPTSIVDLSISKDGFYVAATDIIGRLTVLGLESPEAFATVLNEQYFSTDYSEFMVDDQGFAFDIGTQAPVNLAPTGALCQIDGTPYYEQPVIKTAPFPLSVETVKSNLAAIIEDRKNLDREMDRVHGIFLRNKRNDRLPKKYRDSKSLANLKASPTRIINGNNSNNNTHFTRDIDAVELFESSEDSDSGGSVYHREIRESRHRSNIHSFSSLRRSSRSRTYVASYDDAFQEEDNNYRPSTMTRAERAAARAQRRGEAFRDEFQELDTSSDESSDGEFSEGEFSNDKPRKKRAFNKRGGRKLLEESDHEENAELSELPKELAVPKKSKRGRKQSFRTADMGLDIDREWLSYDHQIENIYSPQLGDIVIYFPQGHKEHLQAFAEGVSPPWLSFPQKWPLVECIVRNINYEFPTNQEFQRCQSLIVKLTLAIKRVPSKSSFARMGHYTLELIEPRQTRHSVGEYTFTVTLRNCHLPDYLVPASIFMRSVHITWFQGTEILVKYKETNESGEMEYKEYKGKVVELSTSDPDWPDSPWEVLVVNFNQMGEDAESAIQSPSDRLGLWEAIPLFVPGSKLYENYHSMSLPVYDKTKCEKIAVEIQTLLENNPEKFSPFEYEVDSRAFPDYYSFIKLPVYLDLIIRRLKNGYYRQMSSLEFDMNKIYENCSLYNADDSEIVKTASELLEKLKSLLDDSNELDHSSETLKVSTGGVSSTEKNSLQNHKRNRKQLEETSSNQNIDLGMTNLLPKRTRTSNENDEEKLLMEGKRNTRASRGSAANDSLSLMISLSPQKDRNRETSSSLPTRTSRSRVNYSEDIIEENDESEEYESENSTESEQDNSEMNNRMKFKARETRNNESLKIRLPKSTQLQETRATRSSRSSHQVVENRRSTRNSNTKYVGNESSSEDSADEESENEDDEYEEKVAKPTARSTRNSRNSKSTKEASDSDFDSEDHDAGNGRKITNSKLSNRLSNTREKSINREIPHHSIPLQSSSVRLDPETKRNLLQILSFVESIDDKGLFVNPVDEEDAPGYYDVIDNPVDLSTLREQIAHRNIHSVEELVKNLFQMYENCDQYNEPSSWLVKECNRQRKLFNKYLKDNKLI